MQETSIRVMNMVRRALLETPDVTDQALYEAAVTLDGSIRELSLKRFQARYPRRVRRLEIGPPRHGKSGRSHWESKDTAQRSARGSHVAVLARADEFVDVIVEPVYRCKD